MKNSPRSFPRAAGTFCPWLATVSFSIFYFFFCERRCHMPPNRPYCELSSSVFFVVFFFFWVDWSMLWQQRTRSKWLLLKVLVIYSALCEPEAGAVMNMTLAPCERRTDSLAVKQALKSETLVGSRKRERKGGDENSISFLCHWNSSVLVKTAALSRQWISFKCLCAKASTGNINTP